MTRPCQYDSIVDLFPNPIKMTPNDPEGIPDVTPELPTATWRLILRMLGLLPARGFSRAFGQLADIPLPPALRNPVLGTFARAVGVNLDEAEKGFDAYPTLNAFFIRRLKADARSWPEDPEAIVSPVDGIVGRFGTVRNGEAIQAKGHHYPIVDLLGDEMEAELYEGGSFLTIYLSPRHYHRIHTPAAGTISRATYLPGHLYPVNAPAVMHIPGLFARNERLVCYLDSARGRIPVVAVGAYNVGRISASFDPGWSGDDMRSWVTNRRPPAPFYRGYDPALKVAAGDEIMIFHLGSTVVLLFQQGVELRPDLVTGMDVQVGERIAI